MTPHILFILSLIILDISLIGMVVQNPSTALRDTWLLVAVIFTIILNVLVFVLHTA